MSRFAAVDIGSNSIRLQIAEVGDSNGALPRLRTLKNVRSVTRLGESVFRTGRLSPRAIVETCLILDRIAATCGEFNIVRHRAVATSAVRDAKNHEKFLRLAERVLASPIDVISGPEEAELVHLGVHVRWPELATSRCLIVDLGGGSAQFTLGDGTRITQKVSRPLGAVRLREKFLKHDPPRRRELYAMVGYIDDRLREAVEKIPVGAIDRLIATSGTAAAVVRAVGRLKKPSEGDMEPAEGLSATSPQVRELYEALSVLPLSKRRGIAGIGRRRAEVIVPGVAVLWRVLEAFRQQALTYTSAGVRDGIIANLALADFEHQQPRQQEHFHVFFCYNKADQPKVSRIAEELTDHGLRPWFDNTQVTGGDTWSDLVNEQLAKTHCAVVFIGPTGLGPSQKAEYNACMHQSSLRAFRIIPVVLKGVEGEPQMPPLLAPFKRIDFRIPYPDPLDALIQSITEDRRFFSATATPEGV